MIIKAAALMRGLAKLASGHGRGVDHLSAVLALDGPRWRVLRGSGPLIGLVTRCAGPRARTSLRSQTGRTGLLGGFVVNAAKSRTGDADFCPFLPSSLPGLALTMLPSESAFSFIRKTGGRFSLWAGRSNARSAFHGALAF